MSLVLDRFRARHLAEQRKTDWKGEFQEFDRDCCLLTGLLGKRSCFGQAFQQLHQQLLSSWRVGQGARVWSTKFRGEGVSAAQRLARLTACRARMLAGCTVRAST